ncbi:cytochrome b [Metapseudomonas resinovorans]|uniref:Putative cytochrome b561 n=1 Tax=Metapseudomonas resinovorans NBRC 106553 TaxID=1245471 RepID=S6BGH4_METRE|nr:cytochrome b/b6 domain-containing protein [Pseudomonas resinovorans]BAN48189.1 putative cytochrome b561 [Pseudomonas resinovorans NBRC 106553]
MTAPTHFAPLLRVIHWLMAILLLAMLFIGISMVGDLSPRHDALVALHKPLGIALLALALVRLAVRLARPLPPLPADMPSWQQRLAKLSHLLLYALMIALPLVGWAMQSAGGYPVALHERLLLPPIVPHDAQLYAALRLAHTVLAYLLFIGILAHLAAALYHALIRRDGVLSSMTTGTGIRRLPDGQ